MPSRPLLYHLMVRPFGNQALGPEHVELPSRLFLALIWGIQIYHSIAFYKYQTDHFFESLIITVAFNQIHNRLEKTLIEKKSVIRPMVEFPAQTSLNLSLSD